MLRTFILYKRSTVLRYIERDADHLETVAKRRGSQKIQGPSSQYRVDRAALACFL